MAIGNPEADVGNVDAAAAHLAAHPSGIPQDQIDNIMSGIANTGDVKMNNHRKKLRQRFDIIKKLGQGTYGKVQLGINKETGQEVAIKTIKKCKIEAEADLVRIRREVQIMSSVQHPNIIHIYEVFENREKMVLVMEFAAGGELYDYLSERKVLSEDEARRIFRQVATAVYYCHKHKICHRDLKLENILLDEHGNAKIADFGLSNVFDDQRLLATFCGSPLYASPEIVEGTPYQGPEVDCWSLGVLLYTLVYGSMPFDGSNFKRLVKQISQGDYYEPKKPSSASTLIRDMLTVCPRKRATIEQICSHWWVNQSDNVSCLDLAEDLANQTPVRLDVLLSLTPAAVTAEQLVVPSADGNSAGKGNERVPRSHSVGSIRDMGANTEAERRILDMVAAGGEAALMPSPTRTITPAQSPVQTKRKLETTISMENASAALKKKEKPGSVSSIAAAAAGTLNSETPMETDEQQIENTEETLPPTVKTTPSKTFSQKDMEAVGNMVEQLIQNDEPHSTTVPATDFVPNPSPVVSRQRTVGKLDAVKEAPEEKDATKVIKKFVNKHKTADLVNAIGQMSADKTSNEQPAKITKPTVPTTVPPFVRKCSLQDESPLNKFNERRKSRILETAEKFQQMNAGNAGDKPKKLVIPGVSVGSYKKEFERKALNPPQQTEGPTAGERRALEQVAAAAAAAQELESTADKTENEMSSTVETSDSKNSVSSLLLDDARRSMENSIALLRQAQNESTKEVDQICAKTEKIGVNDIPTDHVAAERERKLKNARAIIGNAIQPAIRRPPSIGHGFGGGGYEQMRAPSGGFYSYIGDNYDIINNNYNMPNNNLIVTKSTPTSPLTYNSLPFQGTPLPLSKANVALAAARQNIMGRFAADGFNHNHGHNAINPHYLSCSSSKQSTLNNNPNIFNQQKQQQHQAEQPHHQPQKPSHLKPTSFVANVPVATAANATINIINNVPKPFYNTSPTTTTTMLWKSSPGGEPNNGAVKTSTASITLKSATLPRRKTAKTEIQLEIKPRIVEQPSMRFTTEMQHPIADLRSAPPREGPVPYSPIKTAFNTRATSLEPKEHIIPIQRPQTAYTRTSSNTTARSGSLSRQSTVDSESDTTTTNVSQSTITGSSQPIKKSPREFIIPIAMEGGGFITPREGSIEPSESSHTTTSSRSTFNRLRPTRQFGSLLNDTSVDEGLPFQKMRTTTMNRDADEDPRFTLHRLRSSRPVKKISQDNDSQSSGEEDDDDGFEILTAENLFSTLLQRVRALTNRINVNNDLTAGFPNSSRLLSNMRQGQSPFWSQEPFGSRINQSGNSLGAPWRHSISRDLGSDMESMFSRTGATLPRGSKATTVKDSDFTDNGTNRTRTKKQVVHTEEPVDLADLDLSRLQLSKQDLETLSSITPGLPKCFQEQLLAKLPPTQARKLSRTLSMQNSPLISTVKIYKRSQSGGRGVTLPNEVKENVIEENMKPTSTKIASKAQVNDENQIGDTNTQIRRRSIGRSRLDCESGIPTPNETANTMKSRSNSVCRDDYSKSLCTSYTSDINDKYKYYSPYLNKSVKDSSSTTSTNTSSLGRPPSGCMSPPPVITTDIGTSSLRKRSTQRRSRFLRPDFFEEPVTTQVEETPYQREKKLRERETQSVLREIREKSRESSRDRLSNYECDEIMQRKHSVPNESQDISEKQGTRHVRNKSMEMYTECGENSLLHDKTKRHRRSLSRPRDITSEMDKHELADKILQELQLLSAVRSHNEPRLSVPREVSVEKVIDINPNNGITENTEQQYNNEEINKEKITTIKKVKKVKPKEKSTESTSTDADSRITTTVIKKVKKIVKKSDSIKTPATEGTANMPLTEESNIPITELEQLKKESKLKRPKSYPTKDTNQTVTTKSEVPSSTPQTTKLEIKKSVPPTTNADITNAISNVNNTNNNNCLTPRESRLIRPKSYPASKLTPPKVTKQVTRSGIAIPTINESSASTTPKSSSISRQSTCEDKSFSVTPTGKSSIDSSSSSESKPTTIKKIIKVTKKSKLAQPTPLSPTTPTAITAMTNAASSKESSPVTVLQVKEKSPEKKQSKGLFYAIGQKFEKLRDSAMSKEKKSTSNLPTNTSDKKLSSTSSSPEKIKEKLTLTKKKHKPLENDISTKTDKLHTDVNSHNDIETSKNNNVSNDTSEKPLKTEKRSRIDAMIRSLRERSVPRSNPNTGTESNYLKRAVSVEDMPGTFNKNTVNKVLGLFKRFEKDGSDRRVRNTRSTSNIERQLREQSPPTSPIYQNTNALLESAQPIHNKPQTSNLSSANVSKSKQNIEQCCNCELTPPTTTSLSQHISCPECIQDQATNLRSTKRYEEPIKSTDFDCSSYNKLQAQGNKDKRKGLMLDLGKIEKYDNSANRSIKTNAYVNGNGGLYSNLPPYPGTLKNSSNNSSSQQSVENTTNNNNNCIANNNNSSLQTSQTSGYRTSSAHEINRNHLLTPSTENIANYSSDSRSYQDDCASTSTFLSPTDEPELYFDNWSICSEDNYMLHATPSPTVSRLSRTSQLSSPTRGDGSDPNESVIDRIKRRSFYSRFNEKKPKRTSSIVGPTAVRDFYREQQASVKARSSSKLNAEERAKSPDIVKQFFRPLKLSPVGTELKPPVYRSPLDYASANSKPRKSLNDIRPATSPSFHTPKHYGTSTESNFLTTINSSLPMRYKSSSSSSPYEGSSGTTLGGSNYYSTYNPKRRSSYTLNGTIPTGSNITTSSHLDGYATVGRRAIRPYDQRTLSLLDPHTSTSYRRDTRTPVREYSSSISRSNSRYRTSSVSRSPTNI
ncbi:uncharacterized protein LOC119679474 isoform X2 [Teleopsis dalmanni]|uniref:uncharacterized protein LOC119679474 isoform X2 n=1 Tax=Teleopsis dalmanni TaxID=139649 RepID=UPI0018CE9B9F|nr:uncharacterized protein LOC119679474 isoform X2 [Teleopsis dalmanni]